MPKSIFVDSEGLEIKLVSINGKTYRRDNLKSDLPKYRYEASIYRDFLAEEDLPEDQRSRLEGSLSRVESFIKIIETL